MKRYHILAFAVILSLMMVSCSKSEPDTEDIAYSPIVLKEQTRSYVAGGNRFGYKLLRTLVEMEDQSFMISPLSLTFTLAMIAEDKEDDGQVNAIYEELGFEGGSRDDIRQYCSIMAKKLPELSEKVQFSTANIVVFNSDIKIDGDKKELAESAYKYYDSTIENLSFKNRGKVVSVVNDWAEEKTKGKVRNLIDEGYVQQYMRRIIANALYFKGEWRYGFDRKNTVKRTFTNEDGKESRVQMMSMDEPEMINLRENEVLWAVSLPYGNGAFNMNVYLPKSGYGIADAADCLAEGKKINDSALTLQEIRLPKFSLEEKSIRFSPYKDSVTELMQVSSITVDESGTEAATATIPALMVGLSHPFVADHPFLFTITEKSTGAVLFAGTYRGD